MSLWLYAFGVAFAFNLWDWLILDWLVFCTITPKQFVIPGSEGGKEEDGEGPRRVLDREVAVGHLAAEHRLAVALVGRRVDDLVSVVEADVEEPPGDEEDGRPDRRS